MRTGILAAGNFIVDRVKLIDSYPAQDTLASIISETPSNGGGPYNVLSDLARMGAPYPLCAAGLIGADSDGEWILSDCARNGIDTTLLLKSPDHPTSYTDVMTVASTGRRTFFHQRGANSAFTGDRIDFGKTSSSIFYLGYLLLLDHLDGFAPDGRTRASHLLARATSAGLVTTLDLVSTSHPRFRETVRSSLPETDYLFLNEIEAENILGMSVSPDSPEEIATAAAAILAQGVRRAVTLHTGKHAVSADAAGAIHHQPSLEIPPSEILGSNGAGDAFAAGFLHEIHRQNDLPAALLTAVRTAAQSLSDPTPSGGIRRL